MIRVTIHRSGLPQKEVREFKQRQITIGRTGINHIVLANNRVSAVHARIAENDEGIVISDNDAVNGVFVGGELLRGSRVLRPDELVHIAEYELLFERVAESRPAPGDTPTQGKNASGPDETTLLMPRSSVPDPSELSAILPLPGAVTRTSDASLPSASKRLAEPWLAPIPGPDPAGKDPSDSPELQAVLAEIDKQHSLSGGTIDWRAIVRNSDVVLKTQAKELRVACHQALARFKTEQLAGLALGLAILAEITDTFWEQAFPPPARLRARAATLRALLETLEQDLVGYRPGRDERAAIERLNDSAKRLRAVARARYGEAAPYTRFLWQTIEGLLIVPSAPDDDLTYFAPSEAPVQQAPLMPMFPPPFDPGGELGRAPLLAQHLRPDNASREFVDRSLRSTANEMIGMAHSLRRANSSDPVAYRLLRTGLWIYIVALPPVRNDGNTAIPGLPESRRAHLEALEANGKWRELAEESESLLPQHRFVLDLHRYTASALQNLGSDHEAAREAMLAELSSFLRRLPGSVHLRDNTGAELCSDGTREFLAQEGVYRPADADQSLDEPPLFFSNDGSFTTPAVPPSVDSAPRSNPVASEPEARFLEVGLARDLVEHVDYPLYVLVRLHNTPALLERLLARGPVEQFSVDGNRSEMLVDFPAGPNGETVPISLRVTLRSSDFEVDEVTKRVRLYYRHDAPLMTFFVRPRGRGTVNLVVEVQIEDDLVGSEQLWRVCVERSVAQHDLENPFSCQSSSFQPRLGSSAAATRPTRTAEHWLHDLLVQLFATADELYRWVRLNFSQLADSVPRSHASTNEVAFAVVDNALRRGWIDGHFFELLTLQFPRRSRRIAEVRSFFVDPPGAGPQKSSHA